MFQNFKKFFLADWKLNAILAFLICLLVVFSVWQLPYSPATWFDEGILLGVAKSFSAYGVYSLEIAPGEFVLERPFLITSNYPLLFPVSLVIKLFGFNLLAARSVMVFFLFLFALLFYKLAKKIYSKEAAIAGLGLLISFTPFYGNGKAVLGEVPGLVYFLSGLLFLNKDFKFGKLFLAGLFFGFSAATKPFFLILFPAVFIGELYNYKKTKIKFWQRLSTIACGATAPLLVWFVTIFPKPSLSAVMSAVTYYSNSYAAENVGRVIFSNLLRFFAESTPIHFGILFAALLIFIFLKKRQEFKEAEIILFIFILLNILWYLKTPGWYRYFFPAHLLLFLFFPAALFLIFKKRAAFFIIIILFSIQLIHLAAKRNDRLYNSDETVRLANYITKKIPPDAAIFIVNNPSAAYLLSNRPVYQYLRINQALFFSQDNLKDRNGYLFSYIAAVPKETAAVSGLAGLLELSYEEEAAFDHFVLYRKKF